MATKLTLINLAKNDSTTVDELNTNFTRIADEFDKVVHRSGESPSHFTGDLDANSNTITNLAPTSDATDAARRKDVLNPPGRVDMDGQRIINLGEPIGSDDAARFADVQHGFPEQKNHAGAFLKTDGTVANWAEVAPSDIAQEGATNKQAIVWNASLTTWEPGTVAVDPDLATLLATFPYDLGMVNTGSPFSNEGIETTVDMSDGTTSVDLGAV